MNKSILLAALMFGGIVVVAYLVYSQSRFGQDSLLVWPKEVASGGQGDTLVVMLHAFSKNGAALNDVEETLVEFYSERGGAHVLKPDLPLGILSVASTAEITAELLLAIDNEWDRKAKADAPYRRVVLVGHSFGALFSRKIYVVANGETEGAPFEKEIHDSLSALGASSARDRRPWADHVERIILMAGMNRGWSISHHMSLLGAIKLQLGVGLGYVIEFFTGRVPTILTIRRGAPFITQLRLQWLAMERAGQEAEGSRNIATTIQLLGTQDDLVSPEDNVDLVTGKNFIYCDVPESGHANVIKMLAPEEPLGAKAARREVFLDALGLEGHTDLCPEGYYDSIEPENEVTDMVFVIHGIRDLGHWTTKIARRVQETAKKRGGIRTIRAETSSYGYFPMLSFLVPGARQEKVAWLMDRYTEAKARYPEAKFHYVGHSHGTYLLAKALEDYRSVSFDHVVFAGSVVREKYEWQEYIPHRIKKVHNFVANGDWVVGFFPKAFQTLNVQDLGSAGHDGFAAADSLDGVTEPNRLVTGGHSAALQEKMWDVIAEFVLTGNAKQPENELMTDNYKKWVAWPAKVAPLVWVLIGIGLVYVLIRILRSDKRESIKTLMVVGYLGLIWMVITNV